MPSLRRAAYRVARDSAREDYDLLFHRLRLLPRLIAMYPLLNRVITVKMFNGLTGSLSTTKQMFNPTCLPEDNRLTSLKVFNIKAEVKPGLVIHRNHQSPDLEVWRIDRAANCTSTKVLPFEKQVSGNASRNVHKIVLDSLGDPDIEMIKTWMKLRDRELFIIPQSWYWDGQHICLVFGHFEQENLAEYIERPGLQARSNARAITMQLLKGLAVLHGSGIYDFELEPQNIFIGSLSPAQVRLCNLGLPKVPSRTPSCTPEPGLPRERGSHAQNIWSLGCILYQLLTSGVPFSDGSSHCHISCIDREIFSDYCQAGNPHPSKELLESYAGRKAVDLVKQLLTIGKLSAREALEHAWFKGAIGGKHVMQIKYYPPGNDGQGWRQMVLGDNNVLRASRSRVRAVLEKRTIVKSVTLSKYFARQREYERDLDILVGLDQSFVKFLGWFEYSDNIHFMMEDSEYGDLGQYLNDYERSNDDTEHIREVRVAVGEIARQILEGLVYSHEIDAKYCDLRPTNVLVFSIFPMHIKLLVNVYWDTQTTPHVYMAPELLGLQPATELHPASIDSANMWSLGCLIYRILTGKDLFDSGPHQESVSTTHIKMVKQYCDGHTLPTISRIERSSTDREWAQFLKNVLVPSSTPRLSSKIALGGAFFQTIKITNPHRWWVLFKNDTVIHRTGAEKTVWEEIDRFSGSMGTVSLMETTTGRRVQRMAVKALIKHRSGDQNVDYKRELLTLIRLKDDTDLFVRFIGWYEDSHIMYIAMEYVEGGDLGKYLNDHGASARRDAEEITTQLLEGLEFLHKREICHRDLKPQNVLVACHSPIRVKLADFGLAKSTHGTRLRTRVGTPNYQAPELVGLLPAPLRPQAPIVYTDAVDIWSLGCLVYKILVLKIPFFEADDDAIESGCENDSNHEENVDYSLLRGFCYGEREFPKDSLNQAGVSASGINFIERLLVPDPKGRMTADEALNHEWLIGANCKALSSAKSDSQTTRGQLASIGVNISQRTADYLAMVVEGSPNTQPRYLPSSMLRNIDALRHKAHAASLKLLHGILLRIRVTPNDDNPTAPKWSLDPAIVSGADLDSGKVGVL